jgi:hypothetical protein
MGWVLARVALALVLASMLVLRPAAAAEVEYLLVSQPHDLLSTLGLTSGAGATQPPVEHLLVLFPSSSSPTDGRDRQYVLLFFPFIYFYLLIDFIYCLLFTFICISCWAGWSEPKRWGGLCARRRRGCAWPSGTHVATAQLWRTAAAAMTSCSATRRGPAPARSHASTRASPPTGSLPYTSAYTPHHHRHHRHHEVVMSVMSC